MRVFLGVFALVLLGGCSSFSKGMTDENLMGLKSGMKSDEVVKIFGSPHSIRDTTCGGNQPWNCIVWSYEDEWTDQEATFYFRDENGVKVLNSFDIEK